MFIPGVEAFTADDFSVKKWINEALMADLNLDSNTAELGKRNSEVTDEELESPAYTASILAPSTPTLIMRLQLFSNDVEAKLDQLCGDATSSIPRLLHDLEFISRDCRSLRSLVQSINHELDATDRGMSHEAFDALLKMDTVRSRMESSRAALKEAENWNTLSSELDAILASKDLQRAGLRLAEASRSLVLLNGTSEYEDRKAILFKLQNQLESLMSPMLMKALETYNTDEAKQCLTLFDQIQRKSEFSSYYYQVRKNPMLALWRQKFSSGFNGRDFLGSYTSFLEELLALVKKEASWCDKIFDKPVDILRNLVYQILKAIDPSLSSSLEQLAKGPMEERLMLIVSAYQSSTAWSRQIEEMLKHTNNEEDNIDENLGEQGSYPIDYTWLAPIFEPFLPFQDSYGKLELMVLSDAASMVNESKVAAGPRLADIVRAILESVPLLFSKAEAAANRCFVLTAGYGAVALADALNNFFSLAFEGVEGFIQTIRASLKMEEVESYSKQRPGEHIRSASGAQQLGQDDRIQLALMLLTYCQNVWKKLRFFEGNLVRTIVASGEKYLVPNRLRLSTNAPAAEGTESLKDMKEVSFSLQDLQASFEPEYSDASLTFLRSSSLNSFKLNSLIASLQQGDGVTQRTDSRIVIPNNPPIRLLAGTISALNSLTIRSQRFLFDVLFSELRGQIMQVPNLAEWTLNRDPTSTAAEDAVGVEIPRFSLSPLPYITRVGEGLLTLPQTLEIQAGEDGAMGFGVYGLPHLKSGDYDTGDAKERDEEENEEDITHLWITSISRAAMTTFLESIYAIPRLGAYGSRQLSADIDYIMKVFEAMDVSSDKALEALPTLLETAESEFVANAQKKEEGSVWEDEALVKKVARMRGYNL
ncbi:hypothetical protein HDU76_005839 [Blyttiomyces sp. JEL0837]|nr:hypothetical protein HDU76_005839 [Blyttiomyces sp. JEL0837]